jgi:hypothetical protein
VLASTVAWVGTAFGETLVVPIEGIRAIDNGEGATRVMLKFGPLEGLEDMAITRAYVAVSTAERGELSRPIVVQVHPINREWTPEAVSWAAGWRRPGGDFEDEMYARAELGPSAVAGELRIDVESLVREMQSGTRFHGFVLTTAPYRGIGLRAPELLRLAGLSEPRLVVEYEAMPHVRLPEWVN